MRLDCLIDSNKIRSQRNSETEIPLRESPPTLTKEVIENVRPSGKAILTGGDNDELEPEVI